MKISSMLKRSMFPGSLLQLGPSSNILHKLVGVDQDGFALKTEQPVAGYPSVSNRSIWGRLGGSRDSQLEDICTWEKNLPLNR